MSNVIKEFMNMKPGAKFLENVSRIANALERIAGSIDEVRDDHKRGVEAKYGRKELPIPSKRVRPIEMYCCYDDYTWQCEHFVEIPEITPDHMVEQVALEKARKQFTEDSIVFIGLYSVPEDWSDWPQPDDTNEKEGPP